MAVLLLCRDFYVRLLGIGYWKFALYKSHSVDRSNYRHAIQRVLNLLHLLLSLNNSTIHLSLLFPLL